MSIDSLKERLQEHLTDGLVTIIGSGLSIAAGLPSMYDLAEYLQENFETNSALMEFKSEWVGIGAKLKKGIDLEAALNSIPIRSKLIPEIINLTAAYISFAESEVVNKVISDGLELPLMRLLPHLAFNERNIIITSNYDRLIEFSAEAIGLGVDTFFNGQIFGKFNPKASKESLGTSSTLKSGKGLKRVYRKHIAVLKPHGSLDWFLYGGEPICIPYNLRAQRLMITPGDSKYRRGYESPFDHHRSEANAAIDQAARYLIIGYGFNDDHLETHLREELAKGKPCLILAKTLTPSAKNIIKKSSGSIGLEYFNDRNQKGTAVLTNKSLTKFPEISLWDLNFFLKEVLRS